MPATKAQTDQPNQPDEQPTYGIEIVTEKRVTKFKDGREWEREFPIGKNVPVLSIDAPAAFTPVHENALRAEMKSVIKRHGGGDKLYFEVGSTDAEIEDAIKRGIAFLKGQGIAARRSVEFTTYLTRGEW